MTLRFFLVLATSFAVAFATGASSKAATKLTATVGPGSSISLVAGGSVVRSLKAGPYTIVVRDRSKRLNFHLVGPTNSLTRSTTLRFTGTKTWRLKLVKGKYRYFSDRGGALLKRTFRVV
jgi:hypothetical protein